MQVADRLKNTKRNSGSVQIALRYGLWLVISFIMTFSSVVGGACPFAVSVICVSNKKQLPFALVGAGTGYLLFSDGSQTIRYFSAILIAGIGALAIDVFSPKKQAYLPMMMSFLSVLSTGFVMNYREANALGDYALSLGEALLALGSALFFFRSVHCNLRRLKYKALPTADAVCLLISVSVILSGFSFLSVNGIVLSRIIAVFAILSATRYGEQRWALVASLSLGFALGISQRESLFLIGAYAFSALVASLFSALSTFSVALSFCLCMGFFSACASMGALSVCAALESLIAGLVLVLLPEKFSDKIREAFESRKETEPDGSLRQSLTVRLRFASSALAQVSESVRDVREKIDAISRADALGGEMRMVASEQFFSISELLEDLAFELDEAEIFDFKTAGKIRRMLGQYEIYPENISVIANRFDRLRIEVSAPSGTVGLDSPRIKGELEKICRKSFEKGRLSYSPSGMLLSVIEKPDYTASFGFAQYSAEGALCGDTVKSVNDSKGHMVFIISDGMGRGSHAALDGAMGAGLLSKLLCAGFGFDSSLKIVNSALLVKSSEESLATLDCACIDMFSGKCEFYKAGAPRSYILKNGRLSRCELSSMPAGILRGIEFAKRTAVLSDGDEVMMMSDGITDLADEELEELLICDYPTPNEKAQAILDLALKKSDESRRDDMSVIVIRLQRGNYRI